MNIMKAKKTFSANYFILLLLTSILVITACVKNDNESEWTQWRGPARDGVSNEKDLLKTWPEDGPPLAWSADMVGDGFSSTVVKDGRVFTLGKTDTVEILTAFDLAGNLLWQKVTGRASKEKDWPQSRCTPTIFKDKIYTTTVFGDVACFDCETGEKVWALQAHEKFEGKGYNIQTFGVAESPLVFDDKMILTPAGFQTTMVALDRLTGAVIWKSESLNDSISFTSPRLMIRNNRKVIFTSTNKYDIFVDAKTGEIIQKFKHLSGIIPLPVGDGIYFTGEYRKVGSFCTWSPDLQNREIVWQDTVSATAMGGAVLFNEKIIVPGQGKGLYCIDPGTGQVLSYNDEMNYCNLIVADGMLYSYEDRFGKLGLFTLNGTNLELVSSFRVAGGTGPRVAHLSVANGLLFVRRGNVLMAYNIKNISTVS